MPTTPNSARRRDDEHPNGSTTPHQPEARPGSSTGCAAGIRAPQLEELTKFYDVGQIVELTLVVCMSNFTNRFS